MIIHQLFFIVTKLVIWFFEWCVFFLHPDPEKREVHKIKDLKISTSPPPPKKKDKPWWGEGRDFTVFYLFFQISGVNMNFSLCIQ